MQRSSRAVPAVRAVLVGAVLAVALATTLQGCSRGGAAEILDTARLEEVQRNLTHARKLYQEILEKYPDSPEAGEARRRLAALSEEGSPDGSPEGSP